MVMSSRPKPVETFGPDFAGLDETRLITTDIVGLVETF